MNTLINIWTLYQSEINVQFSRFASFIEVGGRTGLGYRDTAQDAMTVLHSNPARCKERIVQLLKGLVSEGYGLHLFEPEWFEETPRQSFKSPTVVPTPDKSSMIHGLADACSDDALWLVSTVADYVRETGDAAFLDMPVPYADKGTDTVYGHLKTILDFSQRMVGAHGICQGPAGGLERLPEPGRGRKRDGELSARLGTGKLCRTGPLVGPKGRRGALRGRAAQRGGRV